MVGEYQAHGRIQRIEPRKELEEIRGKRRTNYHMVKRSFDNDEGQSKQRCKTPRIC